MWCVRARVALPGWACHRGTGGWLMVRGGGGAVAFVLVLFFFLLLVLCEVYYPAYFDVSFFPLCFPVLLFLPCS